ncbi:phage scaffolding protein [Paenibacillus illinoisensis]|uniref:phage scaffolding protein n=1 Tax=Paenibacillus illinoisensis TaxID=59845 RepID=UPI00301C9D9A
MDLKELLGEELYNQVIEKTGDKHKVAIVSDGNWMPKEKFNEANTARKQAEDTLKERDQQLEQLRKSAGDNETLQADIKKLQDENKAAQEKYAADLKELQLNTALKLSLSGQVYDPDIVAGLLDKTKIELNEDGSVKGGLEEQVNGLRDSKAFLFVQKEETAPTAPLFKGIRPPDAGGGGNPPTDPKGYDVGKSLAEQRNQGGSGK